MEACVKHSLSIPIEPWDYTAIVFLLIIKDSSN